MSCVGVFRHESYAKGWFSFSFLLFFPWRARQLLKKQPSKFPDFFCNRKQHKVLYSLIVLIQYGFMHHNGTTVYADISHTAGLRPNDCSNGGPTTLGTLTSALWNPCCCNFLKSAEFRNSQTSWSQTPAVRFSGNLYMNCSLGISFCGVGGVAGFPQVCAAAVWGVLNACHVAIPNRYGQEQHAIILALMASLLWL